MSFRMVPKSVTLNELNGHINSPTNPNRGVMSSNSVASWADYVKVVEDTVH